MVAFSADITTRFMRLKNINFANEIVQKGASCDGQTVVFSEGMAPSSQQICHEGVIASKSSWDNVFVHNHIHYCVTGKSQNLQQASARSTTTCLIPILSLQTGHEIRTRRWRILKSYIAHWCVRTGTALCAVTETGGASKSKHSTHMCYWEISSVNHHHHQDCSYCTPKGMSGEANLPFRVTIYVISNHWHN